MEGEKIYFEERNIWSEKKNGVTDLWIVHTTYLN